MAEDNHYEKQYKMDDNRNNHNSNKNRKKNKSRWLMWLGGLVVLFPKLKGFLTVLKLGKVGGTVISMFVTVGAYALLFPWQFAIGLVIMILIHELGHVWAAKRKGLPVSAPTFIPFLGALITMKRHPRDAQTEAYLAFGGPVIGTLGALATFWLAKHLQSDLLFTIAMVGFFLNLINLLPIHPLDGGRIVTAVSRWFWLLGLVGGLAVIFYMKSILFFIIWTMFAFDLYGKYGPQKKKKLNDLSFQLSIPIEAFELSGMSYMGENHRRRLPFSTYCHLSDGKQVISISWPGISEKLDEIKIPIPSIIHEVEVNGLRRDPVDYPTHILARINVSLEAYENDRYYEVPTRVRWLYGFVYISLAVFLSYMYFFVIPPYIPKL
jgi:Zn-dependent protease